MAFPVSPTNGQVAVVNSISYQFSNVGNTWTRILSTANVITANVLNANDSLTAAYISAVGNITGNYFIGNGALLTGISASGNANTIFNGTSNVSIPVANGNVQINVSGAANTAVIGTGIITLNGAFAGPKTLDATVVVEESINAMLLGPVSLSPTANITIPTSSTLYIYSP